MDDKYLDWDIFGGEDKKLLTRTHLERRRYVLHAVTSFHSFAQILRGRFVGPSRTLASANQYAPQF